MRHGEKRPTLLLEHGKAYPDFLAVPEEAPFHCLMVDVSTFRIACTSNEQITQRVPNKQRDKHSNDSSMIGEEAAHKRQKVESRGGDTMLRKSCTFYV